MKTAKQDKVDITKTWQVNFKTGEVRQFRRKMLFGLITKILNGFIVVDGASHPVSFREENIELGVPLSQEDINEFVKRQELRAKSKFKIMSRNEFMVLTILGVITLMFLFLLSVKMGIFR